MKRILFICMAFTLLLPTFAFGQSAKESIMALKRLGSRVETGISYGDYAPALGEANFQVKLFLESQDAKSNPDLALRLLKAIKHYENALTVWNYKFSQRGNSVALYENSDKEMFRQVLDIYPDAPYEKGWRTNIMPYAVLLSFIWNKASEEIGKASDLLSKSAVKEMSISTENEMLKKENEILRKETAAVKNDLETLKKEHMELKQENDSLKKQLENLKVKDKKK